MKSLTPFLLIISICLLQTLPKQLQAQSDTIDCPFVTNTSIPFCGNYDMFQEKEDLTFLESLLYHMGIQRKFRIEIGSCKKINNFCIAVNRGTPYLYCDSTFIKRLQTYDLNYLKFSRPSPPNPAIDWEAIVIMTHSVRHLLHLNAVKKDRSGSSFSLDQELKIDHFIGKKVCLLGGSLADVQKAYKSALFKDKVTHFKAKMVSARDSLTVISKSYENYFLKDQTNEFALTHSARLAAVQAGYEEGQRLFNYDIPPNECPPSPPKEMIFVEGGSFMMGCTEDDSACAKSEMPQHKVTLSSFYMDKTEVTVGEFKAFIDATGYQTEAEQKGYSYIFLRPVFPELVPDIYWMHSAKGILHSCPTFDHPVVHISWNDAKAYAKWAGKRLPTEAEWEYAARGGQLNKGYRYAGSDSLNEVACYKHNSNNSDYGTHPVGSIGKSNELGLYDMSGNTIEWCADYFRGRQYKITINSVNPTSPPPPQPTSSNPFECFEALSYVLRGGSWQSLPKACRNASRQTRSSSSYNNIGFRCVKALEE